MNRLLATAAPLVGAMTIAGLVNACGGGDAGGGNNGGGGNPAAPTPVAICARIETQTTSLNPRVGETVHVGAQAYTAGNTPITPSPVTFVSSNTAVATVNASGQVTAVAAGAVTITVTCTNGGPPLPTAAVSMTVLPRAISLVLQKAGQGDGFLTSSPAGSQFDAGTRVTITATPNANSTFTAWGGACAGAPAGPCAVVIAAPGPVTVTATFGLHTFVANTSPTFVTSRPSVNCSWNTTAALRLAFTFGIGVGSVPSGNAAITGRISAPSPSELCLAFNDNVNVNPALGGTTGAMTFNSVLLTAGSGNQYRGIFNGVYNSIDRTVSGTLQITYGGVDGNGQTSVNITAR